MLSRLRKTTRPAVTAADLREQHQDAVTELEGARTRFSTAALALLEDPENDATRERHGTARRDVEAGEQRVRELAAAVTAAEARERHDAATRESAEAARHWREVDEHCAERAEAAAALARAAADFAAAEKRLFDASAAIAAAAPIKLDMAGAFLLRGEIDGVSQMTLRKAGTPWAAPRWPWPIDEIRDMQMRVAEGNAFLAAARNKAVA